MSKDMLCAKKYLIIIIMVRTRPTAAAAAIYKYENRDKHTFEVNVARRFLRSSSTDCMTFLSRFRFWLQAAVATTTAPTVVRATQSGEIQRSILSPISPYILTCSPLQPFTFFTVAKSGPRFVGGVEHCELSKTSSKVWLPTRAPRPGPRGDWGIECVVQGLFAWLDEFTPEMGK